VARVEQVNLARLQETPRLLGHTLLVMLDQGRIQELGPDREARWHIDGLVFPLDVQLLDDKTVLVAEYHANRVSERDLRGQILWQKAVAGPLVAQRLPNGNTFIATDSQVLEYDKADNEVLNLAVADEGKKIMKAMKLPSGEVACLTSDARVVRYDVSGKELKEVHAFPVQIAVRLFGGRIHMLPSGRVIVPHNAEDKVVEYDALGKVVWEVAADKPVAAVRLSNGHTLITSMNPSAGAVEVDRTGREVWSYRTSTRVTRALKR
jgi:outer membrane protein assembly factor BamB